MARKKQSQVEEDIDSWPTPRPTQPRITFKFEPKNENQKLLSKLIRTKDVVICGGPAGTGKTFVACAEALKLLVSLDSPIKRIIIAKSVTVTEGEEIGFLKGTMKEKMEPFMESFIDNFHKIIGKTVTQKLLDQEVIQVLPLAYIRGRSIDDTVIILDEAQNVTLKNMRTAMTRIGDNSKLVLIGDSKQIDIRKKAESSLEIVMEIFEGNDKFGTMHFKKSDIVRNPIIIEIEEAFESYEESKASGGKAS
jgi:phosphate starvation-inducible PhoH-like protein